MIVTLILALLSTFFALSAPAWAVNVNCPADSLQSALDNANPGDTIVVSGTCTGNFLVRNDKVRVFIQSTGLVNAVCVGPTATIDGGASGTALDIRGKGISVTCMIITGGNNNGGIVVQRGSNAVLDQNIVQNVNGVGITVALSASGVITNNEIKNNALAGIQVIENSSARIGWNNSISGSAGPNDIHNNGFGIWLLGASSASIVGNTIHNNLLEGIVVSRGAQADVSNNAIDGNGGSGIWVSGNSAVSLTNTTGIFSGPGNTTTTNNHDFGMRCSAGGNVKGSIGTLNGVIGQTSIDSSCHVCPPLDCGF